MLAVAVSVAVVAVSVASFILNLRKLVYHSNSSLNYFQSRITHELGKDMSRQSRGCHDPGRANNHGTRTALEFMEHKSLA